MMRLTPGMELQVEGGAARFVVIRPGDGELQIRCGGRAVVPAAEHEAADGAEPADGEMVLLGKRYVDGESGVELLCTSPGTGPLTIEGRTVSTKDTKPLPASD